MTPPLFLIDQLPAGDVVVLDGDEGRHAATVRRLKIGEEVFVGDGRGSVITGRVASVGRDQIVLDVLERRVEAAPSPRLVVVQALAKGERAELAVELLTELGVDEIVPWSASRSIVQWQGERGAKALERWQRTAREASKQSRRAWVPAVSPLASTADVAARIAAASEAFVLHEDAAVGLPTLPLTVPATSVVMIVGPEGGISDDELRSFEAAGAVAVRLGSAVMRTSTAGSAAAAVMNVRLQRWV